MMELAVLLNQVTFGGNGRFPLALMGVIVLMFIATGWLVYHWAKTGVATLDLLKMCFGFLLLLVVSGLAIMTLTLAQDAVNDPQINEILTMLAVMGGAFTQWAFASGDKNGDKK